ncbi:lecithin retinol acyltransferase domain-containing protein [Ditylenchus destructor]|nr:lecithin retinol acyltransferase domain-containing protein [Ditylenchus destructor]
MANHPTPSANDRAIKGGWRKGVELEPKLSMGDLVEFDRGMYRHWGVYIGIYNGVPSIAHLSTDDGDFDGAGNCSKKCSSKIVKGSSATVRIDPFMKVAKNDDVRCNNAFDYRFSRTPFPPAEIKKRAFAKLGEGGYHVLHNNCEHFAKDCRYGKKATQKTRKDEKNQAEQVLEAAVTVLAFVGLGVLAVGGIAARAAFR